MIQCTVKLEKLLFSISVEGVRAGDTGNTILLRPHLRCVG